MTRRSSFANPAAVPVILILVAGVSAGCQSSRSHREHATERPSPYAAPTHSPAAPSVLPSLPTVAPPAPASADYGMRPYRAVSPRRMITPSPAPVPMVAPDPPTRSTQAKPPTLGFVLPNADAVGRTEVRPTADVVAEEERAPRLLPGLASTFRRLSDAVPGPFGDR